MVCRLLVRLGMKLILATAIASGLLCGPALADAPVVAKQLNVTVTVAVPNQAKRVYVLAVAVGCGQLATKEPSREERILVCPKPDSLEIQWSQRDGARELSASGSMALQGSSTIDNNGVKLTVAVGGPRA